MFRRILFFPISLLALAIASFILLKAIPGNPAELKLIREADVSRSDHQTDQVALTMLEEKYGLNLPLFYFEVVPSENNIWIPSVNFHVDNQFHRWFFGDGFNNAGIIRGDFGISYATAQPVSQLISSRIWWSVLLALFSVLLAYFLSIPIGLKSAASPGSVFDKSSNTLLTILYSIPSFWFATLLLMLFANPEFLSIFPASGVKPLGGMENDSMLDRITAILPYLVLPTITYTYSSLAFISRTVRISILDILRLDFIQTARAKGLEEDKVLRRHAFRNALLPVITIFSGVFPAAIGGSVIIESIFSIPGMGLTIYQSIDARDYPVIMAVFIITGLITMTGYLISDILYALADPRISFQKEN